MPTIILTISTSFRYEIEVNPTPNPGSPHIESITLVQTLQTQRKTKKLDAASVTPQVEAFYAARTQMQASHFDASLERHLGIVLPNAGAKHHEHCSASDYLDLLGLNTPPLEEDVFNTLRKQLLLGSLINPELKPTKLLALPFDQRALRARSILESPTHQALLVEKQSFLTNLEQHYHPLCGKFLNTVVTQLFHQQEHLNVNTPNQVELAGFHTDADGHCYLITLGRFDYVQNTQPAQGSLPCLSLQVSFCEKYWISPEGIPDIFPREIFTWGQDSELLKLIFSRQSSYEKVSAFAQSRALPHPSLQPKAKKNEHPIYDYEHISKLICDVSLLRAAAWELKKCLLNLAEILIQSLHYLVMLSPLQAITVINQFESLILSLLTSRQAQATQRASSPLYPHPYTAKLQVICENNLLILKVEALLLSTPHSRRLEAIKHIIETTHHPLSTEDHGYLQEEFTHYSACLNANEVLKQASTGLLAKPAFLAACQKVKVEVAFFTQTSRQTQWVIQELHTWACACRDDLNSTDLKTYLLTLETIYQQSGYTTPGNLGPSEQKTTAFDRIIAIDLKGKAVSAITFSYYCHYAGLHLKTSSPAEAIVIEFALHRIFHHLERDTQYNIKGIRWYAFWINELICLKDRALRPLIDQIHTAWLTFIVDYCLALVQKFPASDFLNNTMLLVHSDPLARLPAPDQQRVMQAVQTRLRSAEHAAIMRGIRNQSQRLQALLQSPNSVNHIETLEQTALLALYADYLASGSVNQPLENLIGFITRDLPLSFQNHPQSYLKLALGLLCLINIAPIQYGTPETETVVQHMIEQARLLPQNGLLRFINIAAPLLAANASIMRIVQPATYRNLRANLLDQSLQISGKLLLQLTKMTTEERIKIVTQLYSLFHLMREATPEEQEKLTAIAHLLHDKILPDPTQEKEMTEQLHRRLLTLSTALQALPLLSVHSGTTLHRDTKTDREDPALPIIATLDKARSIPTALTFYLGKSLISLEEQSPSTAAPQ